jgi:RNA polymerase sigma-70 factor (ECF subfamily)
MSHLPEDSLSQLGRQQKRSCASYDALDATSPPFRQVLKMFYWDDLSVEEIARTLDVPAGTVKSRLGRGRSMIKARIIEAAGPTRGFAQKLVEWMPPVDLETRAKLGT